MRLPHDQAGIEHIRARSDNALSSACSAPIVRESSISSFWQTAAAQRKYVFFFVDHVQVRSKRMKSTSEVIFKGVELGALGEIFKRPAHAPVVEVLGQQEFNRIVWRDRTHA